jgi:hypothetical protein
MARVAGQVNATPEESDLVAMLSRTFPGLAGMEPAETWRRVDALGLFAASLFAAGAEKLAARGGPL